MTAPQLLAVRAAMVAATMAVVVGGVQEWQRWNAPSAPEREGSILDAAEVDASGYRWQLCTDNAWISTEGVDSGAWTNELLGTADTANGVFVSEELSVFLGDGVHRAYRIDETGELTNLIDPGKTSVYRNGSYQPEPREWLPYKSQYADTDFDPGVPPHHVDELRTLNGVIEAFELTEVQPVTVTDRNGRNFLRFEAPAVTDSALHPHAVEWGAQVLGYYNVVRGSSWVLDVWTDNADTVERVRFQTAEFNDHWAELRFAEGSLAGELPGPGGDDHLGFEASCPPEPGNTQGWMGVETWEPSVTTPLEVSLDPTGRPYDAVADGGEVSRRPLGELTATNGTVFVSDAWLSEDDPLSEAWTVRVAFAAGDGLGRPRLQLDATVLATADSIDGWEEIYGIRLDQPGGTVEEWTTFETGYCTDGGTGRISTAESMVQQPTLFDYAFDESVGLEDFDSDEGADTIIFSNGYGDGCFPMSRGLDRDGNTVSLVVWRPDYPWRLMVSDGRPPSDVTEREEQLQECIDGTRAIEAFGWCSDDE